MNSISIIGAGKVAWSLTKALAEADYEIGTIISRSIHSAKALAKRFENCRFSAEYPDALNSGLIFISVNDEQISSVAESVAALNKDLSSVTFIHLSGSQNIEVLKPLKNKGGSTASLHIMQTFPSKRPVEIRGCFSAVETENEAAAKMLSGLAENLGLKPFRISSEGKVFYHLMGVFASNMLVSNYSDADNLFAMTWNKDINAKELLKPIMQKTLDNLLAKGTVASLSGPVERGDEQTIKNHIDALKDNKITRLNYISGSLNLLEISFKKGSIVREKYETIQKYLINELKKCVSHF